MLSSSQIDNLSSVQCGPKYAQRLSQACKSCQQQKRRCVPYDIDTRERFCTRRLQLIRGPKISAPALSPFLHCFKLHSLKSPPMQNDSLSPTFFCTSFFNTPAARDNFQDSPPSASTGKRKLEISEISEITLSLPSSDSAVNFLDSYVGQGDMQQTTNSTTMDVGSWSYPVVEVYSHLVNSSSNIPLEDHCSQDTYSYHKTYGFEHDINAWGSSSLGPGQF
ncbi:hypothetical protein GYMLUDRAFT_62542 [Collybiopsis luxurians FD-317 M1]|uniref:Uncharacterized protein n=1 Tax=Collybiopsis luxurians FD-317 M1 TaxID=944289 RepID=A0A0D0BKY1_9AGAR|nr:hypothetical protein GYMLUDRAFT_62542 [Collybiopsis luxurians FD-317 M1]